MQKVFIVGAGRSGTTLLASQILAKIPNVIYTDEIDFVWRYGRAFSKNDIRNSGTLKHANYIRKWFSEFSKNQNAHTVIDKTPQNVLRLGWLKQVFPEAKIIHIIRDGRAVALSAAREWEGFSKDSLDSIDFRGKSIGDKLRDVSVRKVRLNERIRDLRSAIEVFADVRKAIRVYANILGVNSGLTWGVRVPGLEQIASEYSILAATGYQWEYCVRAAQNYCRISGSNILEVRYEALVENPYVEVNRVLQYLGMEMQDESFFQDLSIVNDRVTANSFDRYSKQDFEFVDGILKPTLIHLGY